jgi:hypothetical protein
MPAKKAKLRQRQINHVGLNTSFIEIFCAKHALEMALMPENFWTTNIRGIHVVTLSAVKAATNKRQMFVNREKPSEDSTMNRSSPLVNVLHSQAT